MADLYKHGAVMEGPDDAAMTIEMLPPCDCINSEDDLIDSVEELKMNLLILVDSINILREVAKKKIDTCPNHITQ